MVQPLGKRVWLHPKRLKVDLLYDPAIPEFETVLGTLDATHNVPRHAGLPREEHRGFPAPPPLSPFSPPDLDRRVDSPALSGRGSRPSGRT